MSVPEWVVEEMCAAHAGDRFWANMSEPAKDRERAEMRRAGVRLLAIIEERAGPGWMIRSAPSPDLLQGDRFFTLAELLGDEP